MTAYKSISKPLVLAALVCTAGASQAALTVYTTQASFLAAVTAPGTDTFTGFNILNSTPSPITRSAGAYGYTATTNNLSTVGAFGFYGGGTSADPYLSTNNAADTMSFGTFTGGASAIGGNFFASNVGGLYTTGSVTVTAFDTSGSVFRTIAPTGALTGSFLGFVSTTAVTSLTVASVQPSATTFVWPTVDNLTLAAVAPVPEPGTYALMLAGLGLVGFAARRRA